MEHNHAIKEYLREELIIFDGYLHDSVRSANSNLTEMTTYVLNNNGKRLRPTLLLLTSKAFGQIVAETYHAAVAVELLHTATLVHDDVIDESDLRRGQRSVNAVYDNTRAVLLGDYLLSTALAQSVKTKNLEIIKLIAELGKEMAEGELAQFTLANEVIIDEDAYLKVIDKKTASLIRASIIIGAMIVDADRGLIAKLEQIGGILGICFQIRDDIFDYYNFDVGKPTGTDISEGKITLPLIYALNNSSELIKQRMLKIINSRNYSEPNINLLLNFAKEYGGVDYSYKKIDSMLIEAENIISGITIENDIKPYMRLFFSYFRDRSY